MDIFHFYCFPHFYHVLSELPISLLFCFLYFLIQMQSVLITYGLQNFLWAGPRHQRPNLTLFLQEHKFHRERNMLEARLWNV